MQSSKNLELYFERGFFELGISRSSTPSRFRIAHELWAGHPVLGDDPRHCWLADVVQARHLGPRFAAGDDALGDLAALGGIELLAPASDAPLGPGGREAGGG